MKATLEIQEHYIDDPLKIYTNLKKEFIQCSDCKRKLIKVVIENPSVDIVQTFVSECCFCGDKSYETKIMGLLKIAPANNVEMTSSNYHDGVVYFTTRKVAKVYDED